MFILLITCLFFSFSTESTTLNNINNLEGDVPFNETWLDIDCK